MAKTFKDAAHFFNDPRALTEAGFQSSGVNHVYGEPRGADEDALMAEEVSDLWVCVLGEYVRTFMIFEFGYPFCFASLLEDRPACSTQLQSVREHYLLVLKYERLAASEMDIQSLLNEIAFIAKPSLRVSWILWSAAADDKLRFEEQDERAHSINCGRFRGTGRHVLQRMHQLYYATRWTMPTQAHETRWDPE